MYIFVLTMFLAFDSTVGLECDVGFDSGFAFEFDVSFTVDVDVGFDLGFDTGLILMLINVWVLTPVSVLHAMLVLV